MNEFNNSPDPLKIATSSLRNDSPKRAKFPALKQFTKRKSIAIGTDDLNTPKDVKSPSNDAAYQYNFRNEDTFKKSNFRRNSRSRIRGRRMSLSKIIQN